MNVTYDKVFLNADAAAKSEAVSLVNESELLLNVQGTATAFSIQVMGANIAPEVVDASGTALAVINMTDFSVTDTITKQGLYAIALDGVQRVWLSLDGVSGGNVIAYGRMGG